MDITIEELNQMPIEWIVTFADRHNLIIEDGVITGYE